MIEGAIILVACLVIHWLGYKEGMRQQKKIDDRYKLENSDE